MSNRYRVYLAGPCKYAKDEGAEWRESASTNLYMRANSCNISIDIINPLHYYSYRESIGKPDREIKEFFCNKIKMCDVLLVNCNDTNTSPGTAIETEFARCHGIPIIGFGSHEAYSWIKNVNCQAHFEDMDDAIDYIMNYYLLS